MTAFAPDIPVLLHQLDDGVLWLTLNRPERKNAFSPALYGELREALESAATNPAVGAVVLTGAGDAFSAGGDVARMSTADAAPPTAEERRQRLRLNTRIGELLHTMDKPTVAMLRGPAVGAGLSVALACDLRYADTSARLRTGFVQVGLSGDHGMHYFLPRLVGMARARELMLLSPTLDAAAALAAGLLHGVFEPAALETHVGEVARQLAHGPRPALAQIKRNLNDGLHLGLTQMLDAEAARHVACVDSADHKEAARAFVEKRTPRFDH